MPVRRGGERNYPEKFSFKTQFVMKAKQVAGNPGFDSFADKAVFRLKEHCILSLVSSASKTPPFCKDLSRTMLIFPLI